MTDLHCTLHLARRMGSIVEGERYEGEILRFELVAVPAPARGSPEEVRATLRAPLVLRISRRLLDSPGWRRLPAAEVARHGRAYLEEQLRAQGLPAHAPATYVLNERTDGGAFLQGSPYAAAARAPTPSFVVHDAGPGLAAAAG